EGEVEQVAEKAESDRLAERKRQPERPHQEEPAGKRDEERGERDDERQPHQPPIFGGADQLVEGVGILAEDLPSAPGEEGQNRQADEDFGGVDEGLFQGAVGPRSPRWRKLQRVTATQVREMSCGLPPAPGPSLTVSW